MLHGYRDSVTDSCILQLAVVLTTRQARVAGREAGVRRDRAPGRDSCSGHPERCRHVPGHHPLYVQRVPDCSPGRHPEHRVGIERDGARVALRGAAAIRAHRFDRFIIAAADTVMSGSNAELVAEVFPGVPLARDPGEHDTLLSIEKARRVLGYSPQNSWR